ncbi:hypothetical protein [Homoserinimonas sp. OAct 916]|uniref:hypothetical protein n=1 Tax=Homoserinimonas sp. OAct 916 TaxID=2211450 RepID=UPI0013008B19|nr:hypothetical protein [Homoserinimonas sp. OAct 916]
MNQILKCITGFTHEQFREAGRQNDVFRRTASREAHDQFVDGRNILVRLEGYADHVTEVTETIGGAMAAFGRISGRERILGALRWAVLADLYRDELTPEQYDALTTVYHQTAGLVAA